MDRSGRRGRGVALSRRSWTAVAVFVIAFCVFAATTGYAYQSNDVWASNFGSWLIATTGSQHVNGVSMPPLDPSPLRHIWVHQLDDGNEVIARTAGVVVAGAPAYWMFGSGTFSTVPGALTAVLLSSLTLVMVFLTLSEHLRQRQAILATCVLGFSTPVWSVAANGLWPHTLTCFGISGMAWAASKERWLLVGCFGVVCLWARPQTAILILVMAVVLGAMRRDWRLPLRVGAVSAVGLALLSWWNYATFETLSPLGPYDPSATLALMDGTGILTNELGMWVAPDRGILIWTPILLVLLPAVLASWRDLPDWSRALVWGGLGYTVVHASLVEFTGGDSFYGYRFTLELLLCGTPAFALSAPNMGRVAGLFFAPVLGIQTCVIALGSVKDILLVPTDRVWREHTFVAAFASFPAIGVLMLAACVCAAWLARRIWLDPGLTRPEGKLSDAP